MFSEALYYLFIETMEENIETVEEKITVNDMEGLLLHFEEDIYDLTYPDLCDHGVTKRYINVFNSFLK